MTTSYEYAFETFSIHPFDYIVKPFNTTLDSAGGASLEKLAAEFVKQLNASEAKSTGDGDYTF